MKTHLTTKLSVKFAHPNVTDLNFLFLCSLWTVWTVGVRCSSCMPFSFALWLPFAGLVCALFIVVALFSHTLLGVSSSVAFIALYVCIMLLHAFTDFCGCFAPYAYYFVLCVLFCLFVFYWLTLHSLEILVCDDLRLVFCVKVKLQ